MKVLLSIQNKIVFRMPIIIISELVVISSYNNKLCETVQLTTNVQYKLYFHSYTFLLQ